VLGFGAFAARTTSTSRLGSFFGRLAPRFFDVPDRQHTAWWLPLGTKLCCYSCSYSQYRVRTLDVCERDGCQLQPALTDVGGRQHIASFSWLLQPWSLLQGPREQGLVTEPVSVAGLFLAHTVCWKPPSTVCFSRDGPSSPIHFGVPQGFLHPCDAGWEHGVPQRHTMGPCQSV
jgi:hypothetical protein